MPAGKLRGVLGWLDQGQCQQGYAARREMIHALITMALAALAWPFGLHAEVVAMSAAFYCGRERSQAEYRAIKSFYGGKRDSAPVCEGRTHWRSGDKVADSGGNETPRTGRGVSLWLG